MKNVLLTFCFFLLTGMSATLQAGVVVKAPARATQATVRIMTGMFDKTSGDFRAHAKGSGVIISPNGLILTARHILFPDDVPAAEIWAGFIDPLQPGLPPQRARRLKLLAEDKALDLALLKIEGGKTTASVRYPFLPLAASSDLSFGSTLQLVGFPEAGGLTTTVSNVNVVGFETSEGWIKVEGSVLHGASGGAVVNERGELVGIPLQVKADYMPLLNDDDLPLGYLTLGKVGFVRSAEKIGAFLSQHPTLIGNLPLPLVGLTTMGKITDAQTGQPIGGVVVGLISPRAAAPETYISSNELLDHGKSNVTGAFALARPLKAGTYILKAVHPDYKTVLKTIQLAPGANAIDIKLVRE
jgi:Trypsin-like peptidase domain